MADKIEEEIPKNKWMLKSVTFLLDELNSRFSTFALAHNYLVNWVIGITIVQAVLFIILFLKIYG